MFAQPIHEADYSQSAERPGHYTQNLWRVNDTELYKPGERFINDKSPYLESIFEQGLNGPLESAPLPKGLVRFISDLSKELGVVPSRHTSPEDVATRVLSFLDYSEPYYLFVDSAVQLRPNQLKSTYRLKKGGGVLPPDQIECFSVVAGHEFSHYKAAREFLDDPKTREILKGGKVIHKVRGDLATLQDVFARLSQILYGSDSSDMISSWAEEWVYEFYERFRYHTTLTDEEILGLDSQKKVDSVYWHAGLLASLLWFRSRFSLRFLVEYHPIYSEVLTWDEERQAVILAPGSGGEVVVEGWNVYTHHDLIVEESSPPGTCESCKHTLHCTKYINAQALFHPECSCGKTVPVEDTDFQGHNLMSVECGPYLKQHPVFPAFVCQKCIVMALRKLKPEQLRCQRTSCPATQCPHHIGQRAYLGELTKRRTMLLTQLRV